MDTIYKMLGIIARINERMSHLRINLVPINISMMCGLGLVFLMLSLITGDMLIKGGRGLEYWGAMALFSLFTALIGLLFALLFLTFCMKYVVFRKIDAQGPLGDGRQDVVPGQAIDMHVTGSFVLDQRHVQRFLDVPSAISPLEGGGLVLVSNVDASSKFMGFTTTKRMGLWGILLQPNSLLYMELGRLYVGFTIRPAVRIHYREGNAAQSQETAILSFATEFERDVMLKALNGFGVYNMA